MSSHTWVGKEEIKLNFGPIEKFQTDSSSLLLSLTPYGTGMLGEEYCTLISDPSGIGDPLISEPVALGLVTAYLAVFDG